MGDIKLNIYLVRHGEKNKNGTSLSSRGLKQADFLGKELKKIKFDKIYSSDLERCKLTIEKISKYIKGDIIYDSNLREVKGKVKEYPEKYPTEIKKIKRFWNKVMKDKGNVLIVGSGNLNRILIGLAMGINPKDSRFVQIPTGLTHMEVYNKNKILFVCVNSTSHLPEKLRFRQAY
jgi:broad specificity phosphatase PhoE